jgi:hypothetical protein
MTDYGISCIHQSTRQVHRNHFSRCACFLNNVWATSPLGWNNLIHPIFTQVASSLQLNMVGFSNLWWFCGEVFYTHKITNSTDNLKDCKDHDNENWTLLMSLWTAGSSYVREEKTHVKSFYQVFPSVWSRNADTSPCKEERCGRECHCDNSDLKYQCYISWLAVAGSFNCEANWYKKRVYVDS